MNRFDLAVEIAKLAHGSIGQRRKYTEEPYVNHCIRVAEIVRTVTDDEDILIASILHDILEDVAPLNPAFGANTISAMFGSRVLDLVLAVTDVSRPEDGNRARRKEIDRMHLALAHPDARTIKLADLIDNTEDIVKHDKKFAKTYLAEKRLLLPFLTGGSPSLQLRAREALERGELALC